MSLKKSLLKKIARLLMKLHISALFKIKQKGFFLRFYPASISRVLWVEQFFSHDDSLEDRQFFDYYLKCGDVVIDAGANIGSLTLLFSVLVGEKGKVYAIEPHPQTFKYLQGNIKLNKVKNVELFNIALGSKNGDIQFSNLKSDNRNMVISDSSSIKVPLKRLDDLGIKADNISLLKIDVEGYEKFVIEGAAGILPKVQCVYFEAMAKNTIRFGYDPQELSTLLIRYGFEIFEIRNSKIKIIDPKQYTNNSEDLIAVKNRQAFLARTNFQFS